MTRTEDQSTAELVQQASEQVSRLVRDELRLARAEMAEKGRRVGAGAGLFGSAGLVAAYGVGAVLAAAVLGLAEVMPAWLAALVMGIVLFAAAGVMALLGRRNLRRAGSPVPEQAVYSVKADMDELKARAHR